MNVGDPGLVIVVEKDLGKGTGSKAGFAVR
jgi:hypothetical protein